MPRLECKSPGCNYTALRKDHLVRHMRRRHPQMSTRSIQEMGRKSLSECLALRELIQAVSSVWDFGSAILVSSISQDTTLREGSDDPVIGNTELNNHNVHLLNIESRSRHSMQQAMTLQRKLERAVQLGWTVQVETLLRNRYGDGLPFELIDFERLLGLGSRAGHPRVVQLLLENGANANSWFVTKRKGYRDEGTPALQLAAMSGSAEVVQILLNDGANVNSKDSMGRTALDSAIGAGDDIIVNELLARGGVPQKDRYYFKGVNLLESAAQSGNIDIIETLHRAGLVDPDDDAYVSDVTMAAYVAASRGLQDLTCKLSALATKVNVSTSTMMNISLILAVRCERISTVQYILEDGADVNYCYSQPPYNHYSRFTIRTPLMEAADVGSIEIMKILIVAGAVVNGRSGKYRDEYTTALQLAAATGKVDAVQVLLDAGANLKEEKGSDYTAILAATRSQNASIVAMILAADGGAPWGNIRGARRALEIASFKGDSDIVRLLTEAGVQVRSRDLEIAKKRGHHEVVRLLEKHPLLD